MNLKKVHEFGKFTILKKILNFEKKVHGFGKNHQISNKTYEFKNSSLIWTFSSILKIKFHQLKNVCGFQKNITQILKREFTNLKKVHWFFLNH